MTGDDKIVGDEVPVRVAMLGHVQISVLPGHRSSVVSSVTCHLLLLDLFTWSSELIRFLIYSHDIKDNLNSFSPLRPKLSGFYQLSVFLFQKLSVVFPNSSKILVFIRCQLITVQCVLLMSTIC